MRGKKGGVALGVSLCRENLNDVMTSLFHYFFLVEIHRRRYVLLPGAGALHIGSGSRTLRRQIPLPTPYSSRTTD